MLRRVAVENGLVEGLPYADPRIASFKGIPFAAPPAGENRWKATQPAKNWANFIRSGDPNGRDADSQKNTSFEKK